MRVRINDIECREYTSTETKEVFYEIIKWTENTSFGKEQHFIDEGYTDEGDFLRTPSGGCLVAKSLFKLKETCYAIASLHLNRKEPDVKLKSVGSRLLDLTKEEQKDFFEVYEIANMKIYKQHFENGD